ncbi:MAG: sugar transferase [Boseongicola sp.]|nr:sugar transferase [Boseongicola sp.]NNJ68870.1 sugar transferase [Boseongicola sp.]
MARVLRDAALADRIVAVLLLPVVVIILAVLCPVVLLAQGRPFFFASERMATPERAFKLLKIRTMHRSESCECQVLGGDMTASVTPIGRILRRLRLDEFPQIFNVLRGDIRFIGPRPPLRRYVDAYPDLYRRVLKSKPGITGLATVMLHRREERILSRCATAQASDLAYRRYCIAPKARLDLLYQRRRSIGLDFMILFWTVARLRTAR